MMTPKRQTYSRLPDGRTVEIQLRNRVWDVWAAAPNGQPILSPSTRYGAKSLKQAQAHARKLTKMLEQTA